MKKNYFTQRPCHRSLGWLLLMFLMLLPAMGRAQDESSSQTADVPTLNSDNYYEIYNAAQLKWFRDLVNGALTDGTERNQAANAKLMADIDLNNEAWTPIGYESYDMDSNVSIMYTGNFDGNYHTISNLYMPTASVIFINYGFIGLAYNSLIKNLGIVNAKIYGRGSYYVGVVVGEARSVTIQGCWTSGNLDLTGACTAGITGTDYGTVKNCHTSYSKVVDGDTTPTNCTANISADAYKNGVLADLLNSNKESGETGWGQKIGTDEHPVALTADNIVYKVYSGSSNYTVQNINETATLGNNQLAFTGSNDVPLGVDNLVANGACEKFVLNDGVDVYSPSAFKAKKVTYRRTFTDNDFNSLYLPFGTSVDNFTDCEFYAINMFHQYDTDDDGVFDAITLEVNKVPAGSVLLPNHPYLFKYKGTELGDAVEFNLENINVAATETATFECASMSYKYEITGYDQAQTSDDFADCYAIGIDDESGKTALVHPTNGIPAMRWAMKMIPRESQFGAAAASAPAVLGIIIGGDGDTTGIDHVSGTESGKQVVYGLNGVRKNQMTKGVNIVKTAGGKTIKVMKR